MSTKIKSSDGVVFTVPNIYLQKSGTLKSMLKLCTEEEPNDTEEEVLLDKISSEYLKMIVNWLQEDKVPCVLGMQDLFHLIVHTDYLNIPHLVNTLCQILIDNIAEKESFHQLKNAQLLTRPKCFREACLLEGARHLKVCSKCGIAKYCSKDCQKDDWSNHRAICKTISSQKRGMDEEAEPLRYYNFFGQQPGNLFELEAGRFWGIIETRDYCRARSTLAHTLLGLADEKKQSYIYEKALSHFMELLRLIHGDNLGLRYEVPFVMLKMNHHEDCHNFLKWWCTIDPHGRYDWGDPPESKEGDWMYLKDQDIYEDQSLFQKEALQFSVAFMCIKMRIVARFKLMDLVESRVHDAIADCEGLNPLFDILPNLRKLVLGDGSTSEHYDLKKQEEMLQDTLRAVDNSNKIFLPAVLNPEPLFRNNAPCYSSRGSAEEAYITLQSCSGVISSIPIARDVIKYFTKGKIQYDGTFANLGF